MSRLLFEMASGGGTNQHLIQNPILDNRDKRVGISKGNRIPEVLQNLQAALENLASTSSHNLFNTESFI